MAMYKVTVIGDCKVGKTSLVQKFVDPASSDQPSPTVGINLEFKDVSLDNQKHRLCIFDTSGLESWLALTASVYRGTDGFLVVYDVTQPPTFNNLNLHIEKLTRFRGHHVPVILVGNKCDVGDQRAVKFDDASNYAEQHGMIVMETSAMDMYNVEQIFMTLVCKIRDFRENPEKRQDGAKTQRVNLAEDRHSVGHKCWR